MAEVGIVYSLGLDQPPNLFVLQRPPRRLLLAHLMHHFQRRQLDRSVFEVKAGTAYRRVDSLACVLPVESGLVRLRLFPAGAPPLSPPEQSRLFFERSLAGPTYADRPSEGVPRDGGVRTQSSSGTSTSRHRQADSAREGAPPPRGSRQEKDRVAALSEAGLEAGQMAAQLASSAAKSLFSFATSSIKSLAEMTDGAGGQVVKLGRTSVTVKRLLAEGGFGQVYLASGTGGSDFALKKLNCQSREQVQEAHDELGALQRFSNDNIIRLLDHAVVKSGAGTVFYLLFPLYERGTTWDMVASASADSSVRWPFPQARILHIAKGVCRGLEAMHKAGFAHRDIKPHNILLDADDDPVIMDLGSVAPARISVTSRRQASMLQEEAAVKASAPYRAPELTEIPNEIEIDERIDVWSLGCTVFCLAFGNSPFESPREGVLRLAILNGSYKIPDPPRNRDCQYSGGLLDLIVSTLQVDHHARPFVDQILAKLR